MIKKNRLSWKKTLYSTCMQGSMLQSFIVVAVYFQLEGVHFGTFSGVAQ